MDNLNQSKTSIEITQDKLVDILLHAATREDLAKLAADTKENFEKMEAKFDSKIDKFESKFDSKIDKLESKINQLVLIAITGIVIPIAMHFFLK